MILSKSFKPVVKIDKRKVIIEASIQCFAEKGYNNTSVAEVANLANVAIGTVYLYFENKDELLLHSMQEMMKEIIQVLQKKIAKETRAVDQLMIFFIQYIEIFKQRQDLARFMVLELRQSKEFHTRYPDYNPYSEFLEFVQSLIKQSIADGTTLPYDPVSLSYLIIGVIDMILTQWVIDPENVNIEKLTKEVRVILDKSFGT